MDLIFFLLVIAFAGWLSVTMGIQQFKKARYYYHIKSRQVVLHICLLIITPFVFFGIILLGMFLIYSFGVISTGQL